MLGLAVDHFQCEAHCDWLDQPRITLMAGLYACHVTLSCSKRQACQASISQKKASLRTNALGLDVLASLGCAAPHDTSQMMRSRPAAQHTTMWSFHGIHTWAAWAVVLPE